MNGYAKSASGNKGVSRCSGNSYGASLVRSIADVVALAPESSRRISRSVIFPRSCKALPKY